MTTTAPKIFQWRNQVKADRRLGPTDFMVAYQLSERTNAGEFGKSGCLITWQGIAALAAEVGVCERTVQRSIKQLKATHHLVVRPGGGRHRSNRYTLRLQAVAAVGNNDETVTAVSPFLQNPDTAVTVSRERVTSVSRKGDIRVAKPRHPCHPNPYIESFPNSSPDRQTENRGASPRLEGARPPPLGPFRELEPELRQRLGERFSLLSMARLLPSDDADTVRLSALTEYQASQIRQKCEADILAVAGASKLDFTVELPVGASARAVR